jgi:hypothetical protein
MSPLHEICLLLFFMTLWLLAKSVLSELIHFAYFDTFPLKIFGLNVKLIYCMLKYVNAL